MNKYIYPSLWGITETATGLYVLTRLFEDEGME